ncbi:unnamed protein product [Cladocopium goreaui]|uniref:Methyltransferase domain-containing protein n=1 Tax=Cladocopium goreaui TaxID=2562237 RepID=A0A9P1CBD2_9DINO|nr:unnamed protein product [Cladocopium goreaui]
MSLPFQSHCWQCVQRPDNRRGDFLIGWAESGEAGLNQHAQVSALEVDELLPALRRRSPGKSLRQSLLVVKDTVCYRRLAKSTTKADAVLEIGSSLGECTQVLSRAAAVVAIDVSKELVEESRRRHPSCRFEWLDCFQETDRLRDYCQELQLHGRLKIFIDIGGDRSTQDVLQLLFLLEGLVTPSPVLLVVKCEQLVDDLFDYCAPNGRLQMEGPLETLRGARGSRSARQVQRMRLHPYLYRYFYVVMFK